MGIFANPVSWEKLLTGHYETGLHFVLEALCKVLTILTTEHYLPQIINLYLFNP